MSREENYPNADPDATNVPDDVRSIRGEELHNELNYEYLRGGNRLARIQDGVPELSVTDEMLAENSANSWLHYHKNAEQNGYTPVDRLTPDNVDNLELEWEYGVESSAHQTAPVVVPSDPPVMYFTEGDLTVHAVNARTGEEYWTYQYSMPEDIDEWGGINGRHRGVAVRDDTVYYGVYTPEIVALDRYTGEERWTVTTLSPDQQELGYEQQRISFTAAPVAYDGKILFGQSSDSEGWTHFGAVDADSGEQLWTRTAIPPDEWVEETWRFGNGAAWMNPTVDTETGIAYFSCGNPNPMYNGTVRPGPNKWSNSILAVNADTGEMEWGNQLIPHELWDADVCSPPAVFEIDDYIAHEDSEEQVETPTRRVVSHDWKGGWTYTIDAESGQLLARTDEHSPTGGPAFFEVLPRGEENEEPYFPIPSTEWNPGTYHPGTGFRYVGVCDAGRYLYADPDWEYIHENPDESGGGLGGSHRAVPPEDLEEWDREGWAAIKAYDPRFGGEKWEYRFEDMDLEEIGGRYGPGSVMSTAGNLVFAGSSGGNVVALDAETGEKQWDYDTESDLRVQGGVITWDDPNDERQYLAVATHERVLGFAAEG